MKSYNIAIVGATGLVGTTFLRILEEYEIPINTLRLFASPRSAGKTITFHDHKYKVEVIEEGSFKEIDYALFSAGSGPAKQYVPQALAEGAIVIDNSSAFRMEENIPLVVPEVNLEDAYGAKLIANPNCSTIQSVLPLYALSREYGIEEVTYNTYQAVSGSGYDGLEALKGYRNDFYPYDIKKTCIPEIDEFLDDGYTKEEHKMINETKKILHMDTLKISATCVRVPVFYSHGVSIRVKLKEEYSLDQVRTILQNQEGIVLLDDPKNHIYPTSIQSAHTDLVYVGRLRKDKIDSKTLLLYCTADNVRKGAASNAVQIMKGLMDHVESS